jgi:hypothetical protein
MEMVTYTITSISERPPAVGSFLQFVQASYPREDVYSVHSIDYGLRFAGMALVPTQMLRNFLIPRSGASTIVCCEAHRSAAYSSLKSEKIQDRL